MAYWYNVITKQVETDETRSRAADVLGPYTTLEEAKQAIDTFHTRTAQWEADDDAENGAR